MEFYNCCFVKHHATFTSTATDAAGNIGKSTGAAIYGSTGNNALSNTGGNDIMTGGNGSDTFVFSGTKFGSDVITDFRATRWKPRDALVQQICFQ